MNVGGTLGGPQRFRALPFDGGQLLEGQEPRILIKR